MQVGDDEAPVNMDRRRQQIRSRIPQRFDDRNQHMAGVTTALRLLYGGEPGSDRDGELLDTPKGHVHVLDAYAMANSVLCSRRPGPGREGQPSSTMIKNCGRYLRTTIEVLSPTVIHSQGRAAGWSTHQAVERIADQVDWLDEHVARVRVGDVEAVWCSLRHPARYWAHLGRAYLQDTAAPALRAARAAAMGSDRR
jgi:uracil-DNA glycosylase